jgi:hypothetical protein
MLVKLYGSGKKVKQYTESNTDGGGFRLQPFVFGATMTGWTNWPTCSIAWRSFDAIWTESEHATRPFDLPAAERQAVRRRERPTLDER